MRHEIRKRCWECLKILAFTPPKRYARRSDGAMKRISPERTPPIRADRVDKKQDDAQEEEVADEPRLGGSRDTG